MKPKTKLGEVQTADGKALALYAHDGDFSMSLDGQELMHSRANSSERLLGELGVEQIAAEAGASVLIGGLGLGYTLKAVLDQVPFETEVTVVELLPAVIAWNRAELLDLNGALLADPRVVVCEADVTRMIRNAAAYSYDAILLDIDNGPVSMVTADNDRLYSGSGLRAVHSALKPAGRAVFWSARKDVKFESRLKKVGFTVRAVPAKVHPSAKRAAYILYVADRD